MLLEGSRGVLNSWECVRGSLSGLLQSYDGGPTKMNVSLLPQAESGFVGLENLSATCYMNAILQQLFMNHRVRRSLLCAVRTHTTLAYTCTVPDVFRRG